MDLQDRGALWRYLIGATAARTGDELARPALVLAGLAATGSASAGPSLLAGLTIAAAIGGPALGVLLDRSRRPGVVLALALGGYATALAAVVVSLGTLPLAVALVPAVMGGLLASALSGGWAAQLPCVVPASGLRRATSLDALTFDLAGLAGPVIAGAVALVAGASASVAVAVGLVVLSLPAALSLPARGPATGPPTRAARSVRADLVAGVRAIVRRGPLARATATSTVSYLGVGLFTACLPLLGAEVFGAAAYGAILLSGVAAAALVTNAVLARFPHLAAPDTVLWASTLVLAAALFLAATGVPALLVAAVLVAGVGDGPQLAALFAVRHREAPAHLRAQVFTTGAGVKLGGFAVGAAVAVPAAEWSLPGALVLGAGFEVLAVLTFVLTGGPVPALSRGDRGSSRTSDGRTARR
ncbi:MFS transporter [Pseudonocardia nigra]|uniref:MFS transporter n=1 Tax=Pseudonocardia nigra TaxID=1921578 RepID=UPI0027E2C66F|nr:MFS transporter [Pseudonocardia nigra]